MLPRRLWTLAAYWRFERRQTERGDGSGHKRSERRILWASAILLGIALGLAQAWFGGSTAPLPGSLAMRFRH